MYAKAMLFGDIETAEKILKVKLEKIDDNKIIKELGREVKNFDENVWKSKCDDLIYKGLIEKFSQNVELKKKLLETGDKVLVEASPYDKVWGVGIEELPLIYDKTNWHGENRLGQVLMRVRETIRIEDKDV